MQLASTLALESDPIVVLCGSVDFKNGKRVQVQKVYSTPQV